MKAFGLIIAVLAVSTVSVGLSQQAAPSKSYSWDVNGDGVVDTADLMLVGDHFGDASATVGDVNEDGVVNIFDLVLVGIHFGERYDPGTFDQILGKDGAPMVLIPEGDFSMGDHHNVGWEDERPVHTVYLDAFYIDKYEVTNAQYARFLNAYGKNKDRLQHKLMDIGSGKCLVEKINGIYRPKVGYDNHPAVKVSWYGASLYAQFYGKKLPTEAQWEKAARGGLVGKKYSWGDEDPDGTQCNFADKNSDYVWADKNADDGYALSAPVGSFPPNGYGLYDMIGNAWEWCADWFWGGYYGRSPRENPKGPSSGAFRVLRGGGCDSSAFFLRVAFHDALGEQFMYPNYGFRCVQNVTN